jgi:hypothetical protein
MQKILHIARSRGPLCLGSIGSIGKQHFRSHESIFLERKRGDPGAEVGGDGHAFLDRSESRSARLADKRQKNVFQGHRDSPWPPA